MSSFSKAYNPPENIDTYSCKWSDVIFRIFLLVFINDISLIEIQYVFPLWTGHIARGIEIHWCIACLLAALAGTTILESLSQDSGPRSIELTKCTSDPHPVHSRNHREIQVHAPTGREASRGVAHGSEPLLLYHEKLLQGKISF